MGIVDGKLRSKRIDQSPYLFHFTKGSPGEAGRAMYSIIEEEKLMSKNGFISFTASPVTALKRFFETRIFRTGHPLYQPYGIGFSRDILVKHFGARNVIYSSLEELKSMPGNLSWRCERLDVDVYDFEYLREWRIKGGEFDFSQFPKEHILIIAPTKEELNNFVVKHDLVFNPVVDYINGDIDPDWDEVFYRNYKGITLNDAFSKQDDYAVSASTVTQVLGTDMVNELFGPSLFVSGSK